MIFICLSVLMVQDDLARSSEILSVLLKAKLAQEQDRLQDAERLADEVLAIDGSNHDGHVLKIELMLKQRQRNGADRSHATRDLIKRLTWACRQFDGDYRFFKMMGMLLAREPALVETYDLKSPIDYLRRALSLMEQAGLHDRDLGEIHYYQGQWLLKQKRFLDAGASFETVVALNPDMIWAWFYAGQSHELAHCLRSAQRSYVEFSRRARYVPNATRAALDLSLATIETQLDPKTENVQALAELLRENHAGHSEYLETAASLFRVGAFEATGVLLDQMPATARRSGMFRVREYLTLAAQAKYDDALDRLFQALESVSVPAVRDRLLEFALEAVLLSGSYTRWEEAPSQWQALADENPSTALMQQMVTLRAGWGSMDLDALAMRFPADEFVRVQIAHAREFGQSEMASMFLAGVCWRYRDFDRAAELLRTQVDAQADLALRLTYADTLAVQGKSESAFAIYRELRREFGDDPDILNNFGYFILEAGGDSDQARTLIESALEMRPESAACLDSLGWAYFKLGRLEPALELVRRAIALDAHDAEKLEHLGDIRFALGDVDAAREAWSEALRAMSDFSINTRYVAILNKLDPQP